MAFPNNNQPNISFTTVGSEGFVSPSTGRRIWGYLVISAPVAMPITAIRFDDGSVAVEFEVGTPPADAPLPIKLDLVGTEELRDAVFEATGRGWKSL